MTGAVLPWLAPFLLLALPAQAAISCPPSPAAVEVVGAIDPPRIDNTVPQPALQRIAGQRRAGRALGLYTARLEAHWTIALGHREEGGESCRWIDRVVVTLSMPSRVIYISASVGPAAALTRACWRMSASIKRPTTP